MGREEGNVPNAVRDKGRWDRMVLLYPPPLAFKKK
jgi:hypothetical protein